MAAVHYSASGLALAHFDARAHLVVARRILDSLTPGWQQIGAVWLPLPHLANMLPVQVDAWYRSGASGTALSVLSMGLASWALARLVVRVTGSAVAGLAGAGLMLANPNILYLQSAPMTEPILIGTCLLAVLCTANWVDAGARTAPRAAGWAIVAACMTRYEAWPICAVLIVLAAVVLLRRGASLRDAFLAGARLAVYPAVAIALFSANSRWTTGTWFVPSDFYVPDNEAAGDPFRALVQVADSALALSGSAWVWPAPAAAALIVFACIRSRPRASLILLLSLAAAAILPAIAYYQGHPVRVRYGLPLVAACAAATAGGIGLLWAPVRPLAAAAVLGWALVQGSPIDHQAPLVLESLRDEQKQRDRGAVTDYLRAHWDGAPIMMSMGSLAHYMHDLSGLPLDIRDFVHEGNEHLWAHPYRYGPRGFVRWVAIEEHGEGGDALFQAARRDPEYLRGFERVAEGGGVALYRAR